MSVSFAQSAPEPSMTVLETAAQNRFGLFGELPPSPAPTVFVLATDVDGMNENRIYSETGRLLFEQGWLYVTVDLPCHGRDQLDGEPANLAGWAHRVKAGQDLTGPFVGRCRDVLNYLVDHGYTDPARVAVCGTSRGGFCALHFAAADARVRAVACVSPVTNLLALREFNGVTVDQVQRFNVEALVPKLSGRSIWISIGNDDQRVSTVACEAVAQRLKIHAVDSRLIELVVAPTSGHEPIKDAYQLAAKFLRRQVPDSGDP